MPASAPAVKPVKSRAGRARPLPASLRRFPVTSRRGPALCAWRGPVYPDAKQWDGGETRAAGGCGGREKAQCRVRPSTAEGSETIHLWASAFSVKRVRWDAGSPLLTVPPLQWTAAFTGPPGPCSPTSAGPCRTARLARPRLLGAIGCRLSVSPDTPRPVGSRKGAWCPWGLMARFSEFLESFSGGTSNQKCQDLAPSRFPRTPGSRWKASAWRLGRRKDLKGGGELRGRGLREPSHAPPRAYACGDWSGVYRGVRWGSGAYLYARKGEILPWGAS